MMRLDPKQLHQYLLQHGASANEAAMLTGMAGAESNYNPGTSHDGGTGYGLWGHRNERWRAMQQLSGARYPAWQQQADYALRELHDKNMPTYQGMASRALAAALSPADVTRAGMHFERPLGYTAAHPELGHNYSGRLALVTPYAGGGTTPTAAASIATPRAETPQLDIAPPPAPEAEPDAPEMSYAMAGEEGSPSYDQTNLGDLNQPMNAEFEMTDATGGAGQSIHQKAAMRKQKVAELTTPLGQLFNEQVVGMAGKGRA
jgi:hypothetical protein